MKYATEYSDLEKDTLYNNIKGVDYPPCDDYLDGLTITSCDYKEVFERYKDVPGVVFLVDPPYLSTVSYTHLDVYKRQMELQVRPKIYRQICYQRASRQYGRPRPPARTRQQPREYSTSLRQITPIYRCV